MQNLKVARFCIYFRSYKEQKQAGLWCMHNNSISAKEKKYIHLQNFKLALSTNEQVLHVKHAGWPLALLQHYFADRFFLFLFHSCISYQGREESNFPVILSRMYIHTATQKQALQTKKKSSLSFRRTGCVCHPAHLPVCHLTCISLSLPSVIPQCLIQSNHLTLTILGFKTALIFAGFLQIQFNTSKQ